MAINADVIKELAAACGFELAGIAPAIPSNDFARFENWRMQGRAGEMNYLTDRRGDLRTDPQNLLPGAQAIVCVGKLYNTGLPNSTEMFDSERGWIARYAWGADYHDVMRRSLEQLVDLIRERHGEPFESRICVDTAPLLERTYARLAGLGWIGCNTCLINQERGSWFFLGEILLSLPLACDAPPPDRCGTCSRCIDACPTDAILPNSDGSWSVDSRLCISYLTIEKRGALPPEIAGKAAHHIFGCDICQDVCPWNGRAPVTSDPSFAAGAFAPSLEELSTLTTDEFRAAFRHTPVWRAKYAGFLRNVAWAMGNSGNPRMQEPLQRLTRHADPVVAEAAEQALHRLSAETGSA